MKKEEQQLDIYGNPPPDGSLRKFSDFLMEKQGKLLEIYIGDQCETLNFEDYSVPQNCSIFGRLVEVMDRFVVLECLYLDKNNTLRSDNRILVNAFQIRAMTELNDEGCLSDAFLDAKKAAKIRKLLAAGKLK